MSSGSNSLRKFGFAQRVQRIKTTVSDEQMAQAIIQAWQDLFGSLPSKEQVSLVLAQNALETGHKNSMWNYNIGNLTTDGKGPYDYYDDITTQEQIHPDVWAPMNLKYRAYATLEDGVKDYLKLLSGSHYSEAWQHILHPDPVEFSKSLKRAGYYTTNEAPYTKTLSSLFGKFNNSDAYDTAKNQSPTSNNMMITDMNKTVPNNDVLEDTLNQYVQMLAAAPHISKKIIKKALPNHDILIKVSTSDYTNAIEFSRILCSALDEELLSQSYTHTDSKLVEIECSIAGPAQECFAAVQQLSNAVAEVFYDATIKIGGVHIKVDCVMNKKSSYQPISLKTASTNYRKFLLKFV